MVRSSQPQALAALYSERLPFRRSQALGDASWHVEGTETIREVHQARLLRQLEGIEMAWCASDADANLLAGLRPGAGRHAPGAAPVAARPGQGVRRPRGRGPGGDRQFRRRRRPRGPGPAGARRACPGLAPAGHEPEGHGRERLAHSRPRPHGRRRRGPRSCPPAVTWWGLEHGPAGGGARRPRDQRLRRGCRPRWRRGRPGCARPRRWRGPTWRRGRPGRRGRCRHHGPSRLGAADRRGRLGRRRRRPRASPGRPARAAPGRADRCPARARGSTRPGAPLWPVERRLVHPAAAAGAGAPAPQRRGRPARHFRPRQPERRRALRAVAPAPGAEHRGGGGHRGRGGPGRLPAHHLGAHARVRHRGLDAGGGRRSP